MNEQITKEELNWAWKLLDKLGPMPDNQRDITILVLEKRKIEQDIKNSFKESILTLERYACTCDAMIGHTCNIHELIRNTKV